MLETQVVRYLESFRHRNPIPVTVLLWDGTEVPLGDDSKVGIRLRSTSAARYLLHPSLDALGEGYVEGHLDVDGRITDIVEIAEALARDADDRQGKGRLPAWLARHTRRSDRAAIEYHYDVSNAFYARWLDPAMVYSCGYFDTPERDLASAQIAKLDHICRKLRLAPGQSLLDIGCGWGAMAMHAARHYGVRAVGITLSRNQFELATERVAQAGLSDRVEIRLQDYRDLPQRESFDRIASIGMFEHVGLKQLGACFTTVHRLLVPGGVAMNHGITSADADSRSVGLGAGDFINRYVFPDGEVPHVSLAIQAMSAAGLELVDAESLRRHYALTCRHWSEAFEHNIVELERMAGAQRARIWRVYLAGCAHAFAKGWINIYQLLAIRSNDGSSPLPLTRDYMYGSR
ncbi:MAG: class I SAM-dependent methyltransferase [Burkholderiaceae bacterium]